MNGTRPQGARSFALLGATVLMAGSCVLASAAEADDGGGPLGVTVVASGVAAAGRVGVLVDADEVGKPAGEHFCTASVVRSEGRDLILTAAHCLGGVDGSGVVFVPGYRDGKAPYGVWKVKRSFLPGGWAQEQSEDSDIAFAALAPNAAGEEIEDVVGANVFAPGTTTGASPVTVTGYPDTSEQAITCTNRPSVHSRTQQRIECPRFSAGTSGSPWVNGHHEVVGVLGGHEQGGDTDDVSYSVVLGTEAAELYRKAGG
ncbi:trypsin-like peptidase domain-containing protein [Streptomyces roseirectus]|uniref:Trypsin-like peptidase domain-containing protein n=1 Tax=Streptomyces roseirectus TaxID=2768066 RepID=A0A7H0IGB5_9ACTN|nr:trypsin-like peptidase domain-containing protein [Streptomyces roseirectus]QNP71831.1 trypsin-like peptidase domain-containing protein [Streptomyces roseirectus]